MVLTKSEALWQRLKHSEQQTYEVSWINNIILRNLYRLPGGFPEGSDSEYFSQHLGEYENVLAALEDLNGSLLKAMDKTKKDYQEATHLEQFVTRFLLKETTSQLQSLQSSLECAMETTAEQTRQDRQGPVKPEVLSIQWSGRRSNRRLQRNNSLSPNNPLLNLVNSGDYSVSQCCGGRKGHKRTPPVGMQLTADLERS